MSEKRELAIVALSASESQPGNYVLILEEQEQQRRIPVIIGMPEARAIAIAMEQMQPVRPLAHDLMKNIIQVLGGNLLEVIITRLEDGVFFSVLVLRHPDGSRIETDARTSDAIALAVRFGVPVFTFENVIMEAGISAHQMEGRATGGSLAQYSIRELEDLLQKVLEKEDYESATKIRDYIRKRSEDA